MSGGAEQSRVIDADSSENVFELRFDRNSYGLWFVSNYPDGSGRSEEELAYTYLYGEEIDFPQSVPSRRTVTDFRLGRLHEFGL